MCARLVKCTVYTIRHLPCSRPLHRLLPLCNLFDVTRLPALEALSWDRSSSSWCTCICLPDRFYPLRQLPSALHGRLLVLCEFQARHVLKTFLSIKRELFNNRCCFKAPSSSCRTTTPTSMLADTASHQIVAHIATRRVQRAPILFRHHLSKSTGKCPATRCHRIFVDTHQFHRGHHTVTFATVHHFRPSLAAICTKARVRTTARLLARGHYGHI